MKKIILILFVFTFLCQGCTDRIDRVNRYYVLENGTNHYIKIDFFYLKNQSLYNDSISGKGVIFEGLSTNDTGSSISAINALGSDSIVVTYDGIKRQVYYYSYLSYSLEAIPATTHNPLADTAYEVINNELYRFTFTEADYENAEEIGG